VGRLGGETRVGPQSRGAVTRYPAEGGVPVGIRNRGRGIGRPEEPPLPQQVAFVVEALDRRRGGVLRPRALEVGWNGALAEHAHDAQRGGGREPVRVVGVLDDREARERPASLAASSALERDMPRRASA